MPYKNPEAKEAYDRRRREARRNALGVDRLPFARNKSTHVALLYLRMRRGPVSPTELVSFNRTLFGHDVYRPLGKLTKAGYAVKTSDGDYVVTKAGIDILYKMAAQWA